MFLKEIRVAKALGSGKKRACFVIIRIIKSSKLISSSLLVWLIPLYSYFLTLSDLLLLTSV